MCAATVHASCVRPCSSQVQEFEGQVQNLHMDHCDHESVNIPLNWQARASQVFLAESADDPRCLNVQVPSMAGAAPGLEVDRTAQWVLAESVGDLLCLNVQVPSTARAAPGLEVERTAQWVLAESADDLLCLNVQVPSIARAAPGLEAERTAQWIRQVSYGRDSWCSQDADWQSEGRVAKPL